MPHSSNQADFLFSISGLSYSFRVLGFEAVEAVSAPFQVNVTVASEKVVPYEDVAGREAVLTVLSHDVAAKRGKRYFHGNIGKFKTIGENQDYHIYRVRLLPAIWRLSLEQDCRIFQDTTLQSIVETILKESGITSDMYRFLLKEQNLRSQYCVQYNESDFNFISRLLEEEGIFYFFEHYEDRHITVFCDFSFHCADIAGTPVIPYDVSDGTVRDRETIAAFNTSHRVLPDAVTNKSFNFKRSRFDLVAENKARKDGKAEIYEFTGNFGSVERGKKLARIRMEEHVTTQCRAKGESNCPHLIPGCVFSLDERGFTTKAQKYLLLGVEHVGDQPQSLDALGAGSAEYWNGFICIPESQNLRPTRITPKPVIPGMQTAIVTGPSGEQIYHDGYGRVKVQFHWDRQGTKSEKSSCWLRYAQGWGGGGWGMQFIPRVGDEVLVAFLDGDPDRPVIVGSLFNSTNPPLYDPLEKRSISTIKTRSYPNGGRDNFHELRFEDRKGSEEIYLQSERDWNILVKNDKGQVIGNDETLLVRNDRKKTVQMSQTECVGVDKSIEVGADHRERIGANMTTSVGANKTETVGGNSAETVTLAKELTVGGLYQVSVGGVVNETVAGAKTEEIGMAKAVMVAADMSEQVLGSRQVKVGGTFEISAGESFQIVCGSSVFRMDSDGSLFMNGSRIQLSASGTMKVTGEDIQLN